MRRFTAFVLASTLALAAAPAAVRAADDQEAQIGQQEYASLQQKGEIIARPNALYSALDPIASRIKRVADSQYGTPFNFILVHEAQPNAFAVPGGNVYVTDSLMHFVANREELAGVLCHETSHDIHHDVINNMQKEQPVAIGAAILSSMIGGGNNRMANAALGLGTQLTFGNFSRRVETNADLKGSETCAQAGYNPWGMVWLFQKFSQSGSGGSLEMLSDHPSDNHRIADLESHFRQDPSLFSRFPSSIANATPLRVGYVRRRAAHN